MGTCPIELNVAAENTARGFYESIGMALNPDLPYVIQDEDFSRPVEETQASSST